MALLAAMLPVGVLLGVCWAWPRRPSRLVALIEVDQQLKLDDLLSSAMTAKDDAFGQTVRAMAERACQKLSPSQVMLNRLGVRAWGGIGLAWATVIVLALLVGNADTRAGEDSSTATTLPGGGRPSNETRSEARHLPGREQGVDDRRDFGEGESPAAVGVAQPAKGGGSDTGNAATGTGGGTAKTESTAVATPGTGTTTGQSTPGGETATGAGRGSPGTGYATGGTGGASDRQATPWRSTQWPIDRANALQAVHDGRVPDAYRDIIQEYFRPE
jgi:hypothetical protein